MGLCQTEVGEEREVSKVQTKGRKSKTDSWAQSWLMYGTLLPDWSQVMGWSRPVSHWLFYLSLPRPHLPSSPRALIGLFLLALLLIFSFSRFTISSSSALEKERSWKEGEWEWESSEREKNKHFNNLCCTVIMTVSIEYGYLLSMYSIFTFQPSRSASAKHPSSHVLIWATFLTETNHNQWIFISNTSNTIFIIVQVKAITSHLYAFWV